MEQARELNPSVTLRHHHLASVREAATDNYLASEIGPVSMFFLVNEATYEGAARALGEACRRMAIPFQWLLTRAMQALLISDLGPLHVYEEERKRVDPETRETVRETETKSIAFAPLSDLWSGHSAAAAKGRDGNKRKTSRALPAVFSPVFGEIQKQIEGGKFFLGDGSVLDEVPAVNAIMGAIAAQEAVKVITGKDLPIHNVVLFDGTTLDSTIISIS